MSEPTLRRDPHTAVKQELLVRYLDAWTPTVLRAHRRAAYLECSRDGSAATALRVFGEFADRLEDHRLDVVVLAAPGAPLRAVLDELGEPPGLSLRTVDDPSGLAVSGPVLAHLDLVGPGPLDETAAWRLIGSLATGRAANRAGELLLTREPLTAAQVTGHRSRLRDAGLARVAHVELVDESGRAQLLIFATPAEKHLVTFKDALWALDELAGIRYRDPRDPERTLVDISLNPQLLPLRHALLEELGHRGECQVADLRRHTLTETIYRPDDATRVLTSLASAGVISREPGKGRLTPRTLVRLARP